MNPIGSAMSCKCILCLSEPSNCPVLTDYSLCKCKKGVFMCLRCAQEFFPTSRNGVTRTKCVICKTAIQYSHWRPPYMLAYGLWTAAPMEQQCSCGATFSDAYGLFDHIRMECPQSLVFCPSGQEPTAIPRSMLQEHIRSCSYFLYPCRVCKGYHNRYLRDGCEEKESAAAEPLPPSPSAPLPPISSAWYPAQSPDHWTRIRSVANSADWEIATIFDQLTGSRSEVHRES